MIYTIIKQNFDALILINFSYNMCLILILGKIRYYIQKDHDDDKLGNIFNRLSYITFSSCMLKTTVPFLSITGTYPCVFLQYNVYCRPTHIFLYN